MAETVKKLAGQSLVESVLLLPLFLLFAFGLLQVAQLGVALLVTNYAASSIARKASNDNSFGGSATVVNLMAYEPKAESLMVAGMQLDSPAGFRGCASRDDPSVPTATLQVAVRAKVAAWPFFSQVLNGVWKGQYDPQPLLCPSTVDSNAFGPFNFSAQAPYYFYVTGRASVRMNYVPQ